MQRSVYFFTWGRSLIPGKLLSRNTILRRKLSTSTTQFQQSTSPLNVSYYHCKEENGLLQNVQRKEQEKSYQGGHRAVYVEKLAHTALREYLDTPTQAGREKYYDSIQTDWPALPAVTMSFLHWKAYYPLRSLDEIPHIRKFFERGYHLKQLERWAWIISAESSDDMVARLKSLEPLRVPAFLILQISRVDLLEAKSLNDLLAYLRRCGIAEYRQNGWYDINGIKGEASVGNSVCGSVIRPTDLQQDRPIYFQDAQFMRMITFLLKQARRIWSPAVVDIVRLAEIYLLSSIPNISEPISLDPRSLERLCGFVNNIIVKLSLPALVEPMKSTTYSWSAQKRLLVLTGKFDPPILLNRMSYLSIITVLSGSKKTEREDWVATHRKRTWPPWRVDQDGMDAKRLPEDDLSRVVLGLMRMKEAGIRGSSDVLTIMGGQDCDGTPTIHTRNPVKLRNLAAWTDPNRETRTESEPDLPSWIARIEATRDVQEAWSAFKKFLELGGRPHLDLYFPMLRKLNYENARLGRKHIFNAAPGDGREVFPPANDNISEYYKMTLQPPSYDELYEHMIASEVQPEGRCLSFLLQHAKTIEDGFRYLRDSGLDEVTLTLLTTRPNARTSVRFFSEAGRAVFAGFLAMLCRFAPRAVLKSSEEFETSNVADVEEITSNISAPIVRPQCLPQEKNELMPNEHSPNQLRLQTDLDQEAVSKEPASERVQNLKDLWTVIEIQNRFWKSHYIANPLSHAITLLTLGKIRWVPAWYTVFRGLAVEDVLTSRQYIGESLNDDYSWRISLALLREFKSIGLKLDPRGFLLLCQTFDKFALATVSPDKLHNHSSLELPDVLKTEFDRLLETAKVTHEDEQLRFLHLIGGVHLHAYIRCLGHVKNYEEIVRVLKWMVAHHRHLDELASQARNGDLMMRRALIAIRIFLDGTNHDEIAKNLVETVGCWLGWPHDFEVNIYKDNKEWKEEEISEDEQPEVSQQLNTQDHLERDSLLLKQAQLQEQRRNQMKDRQRERPYPREKEGTRETERQLKKNRQAQKEQQLKNGQQLDWNRRGRRGQLWDTTERTRETQNELKSYSSLFSFRPGEGRSNSVPWLKGERQPKMDEHLAKGGQSQNPNQLTTTQPTKEQQSKEDSEGREIETKIRRVALVTGTSMLMFKYEAEAANDGRRINVHSPRQSRLRHSLERRRKLSQEEERKKEIMQLARLMEENEAGKESKILSHGHS